MVNILFICCDPLGFRDAPTWITVIVRRNEAEYIFLTLKQKTFKMSAKFNESGNISGFYPYTGHNTRGIIHEGYFRNLREGEIYQHGQEVLYTRKCRFTNTFMTAIVDTAEVSYYLNERPVYRVWLKNKMGGILMPLIHSSTYDSIVEEAKKLPNNDQKWLDNWNKEISI